MEIPSLPNGTEIVCKREGYVIRNRQNNISVYGYKFEIALKRFRYEAKYNGIKKQKLRREVRDSDSGTCFLCGTRKDLTTDHIVPKSFFASFGRKDEAEKPENMSVICKTCNSIKDSYIDLKDDNTRKIVLNFLNEIMSGKFEDRDKLYEKPKRNTKRI